MRFVYSDHARRRMRERGVTESMVERVLAAPDVLVEGETADEYTGVVDGVRLRFYLARGTEPRLVITLYPLNR